MSPTPNVRCPACRKVGDWFAGDYGPFCSQRCRLVDLGKWLNGEHAISEPLHVADPNALGEPTSDCDPDRSGSVG